MSSSSVRALVALLVVPAALGAQASGDTLRARTISLTEAVNLGRENALAAVQARGQVENANTAVRTARAALLPSLNLSLSQVKTRLFRARKMFKDRFQAYLGDFHAVS